LRFGSSYALADINRLRSGGHDIRAAIASRTDEPHWARICLKHLVIEDGSTLQSCFPDPKLVEIGGGSKTGHLHRLHQASGVAFEDMAFFDNEWWNIQDVRKGLPAVECVHTPHGMTRDAWDACKRKFGLPCST
jgi:magnesium-dependent phosphatase 1